MYIFLCRCPSANLLPRPPLPCCEMMQQRLSQFNTLSSLAPQSLLDIYQVRMRSCVMCHSITVTRCVGKLSWAEQGHTRVEIAVLFCPCMNLKLCRWLHQKTLVMQPNIQLIQWCFATRKSLTPSHSLLRSDHSSHLYWKMKQSRWLRFLCDARHQYC